MEQLHHIVPPLSITAHCEMLFSPCKVAFYNQTTKMQSLHPHARRHDILDPLSRTNQLHAQIPEWRCSLPLLLTAWDMSLSKNMCECVCWCKLLFASNLINHLLDQTHDNISVSHTPRKCSAGSSEDHSVNCQAAYTQQSQCVNVTVWHVALYNQSLSTPVLPGAIADEETSAVPYGGKWVFH